MIRSLMFFVAVCFLLNFPVSAQVPHPTLLSMEQFGGEDYDQIPVRVIKTYDGGFVMCIGTRSATGNLNTTCTTTAARAVFNKYNADATVLEWQKCRADNSDSSYAYCFPLPNGNIVYGGASFSTTAQDFMLKKEDANGNTLWVKQYGGTNGDILRDMTMTSDGGFVMTGVSNSFDGDVGYHNGGPFNLDIWVLKVDSTGLIQYSRVIGGTENEEVFCIVPRTMGGYYVLGRTASTDSDCIGNHGHVDALLTRLDDTLGKVWTRCLGGTSDDALWKGWAIEDGIGGVLMTTDVYSNNGDVTGYIGSGDFWLADVDSNQQIIWSKCYGGGNGDTPNAMCRGTDGTLWFGGISGSNDGQVGETYGYGDAFIVHTDSIGNFLSSRVMGSGQRDEVRLLHALSNGLVLAGGTYENTGVKDIPSTWYGLTDVFLARLAPWTTRINNINKDGKHKLEVYPNPSKNKIYIRSKQVTRLKILNTSGQEMLSRDHVPDFLELDVSIWTKGTYYVQTLWEDNSSQVVKISIN